MDFAKNFAEWRDLPAEQWLARANRVLPPLVVLILVILLAFQAAGLTWRLLAQPADQDIVPPPINFNAGGPGPRVSDGIAYEAITGLFGEPPAVDAAPLLAEEVLDAAETTLNLTLKGSVQSQELPERGSQVLAESGIAVIARGQGPGMVYQTGETIDDSSGAKLHSVFTDRVLLDRGGRLEKLSFPTPDELPQAAPRLNSNVRATSRPTIRSEPDLRTAAADADAVSNAAQVLAQHIQIAPQEENGEQIGYRLQPQQNSQVFVQLGLQPGDVLTEVNGIPLRDLRSTATVIQALSQSAQASVNIRRNGNDIPMIIDIAQIQQLSNSLQ